ncbi:hypothetical protein METBIDRAFT_31485 [Metschnikowia bicuspidata var. bicuspidata NRRL YB-4993]|uniref:Uncharacterized protein n=1 Tax=Metschnikowia bicuspidata var. bicuspidata NRRL YB-4993 TaxID=869754 RepID=A0A1A0HF52_9ASCO|nr:hypothetical protein METBIDRAFT_31485 [Metschnikowia bicuspidata var. bicuspidata NRRL YB-4993]OBA22610.1 hypothetical protein METBIDRAFT_31485 [Metschnikowia bicuspidata var. bicuspidata NRRL YB-4993]
MSKTSSKRKPKRRATCKKCSRKDICNPPVRAYIRKQPICECLLIYAYMSTQVILRRGWKHVINGNSQKETVAWLKTDKQIPTALRFEHSRTHSSKRQ